MQAVGRQRRRLSSSLRQPGQRRRAVPKVPEGCARRRPRDQGERLHPRWEAQDGLGSLQGPDRGGDQAAGRTADGQAAASTQHRGHRDGETGLRVRHGDRASETSVSLGTVLRAQAGPRGWFLRGGEAQHRHELEPDGLQRVPDGGRRHAFEEPQGTDEGLRRPDAGGPGGAGQQVQGNGCVHGLREDALRGQPEAHHGFHGDVLEVRRLVEGASGVGPRHHQHQRHAGRVPLHQPRPGLRPVHPRETSGPHQLGPRHQVGLGDGHQGPRLAVAQVPGLVRVRRQDGRVPGSIRTGPGGDVPAAPWTEEEVGGIRRRGRHLDWRRRGQGQRPQHGEEPQEEGPEQGQQEGSQGRAESRQRPPGRGSWRSSRRQRRSRRQRWSRR